LKVLLHRNSKGRKSKGKGSNDARLNSQNEAANISQIVAKKPMTTEVGLLLLWPFDFFGASLLERFGSLHFRSILLPTLRR